MAALNYQQRKLLKYLVTDAKGDLEKAAAMAGYYNPAQSARRLANNKRLATVMAQRLENAGVPDETEILARLADMATFDPMEFFNFDEDGNASSFDLKRLKKSRRGHVVKKVKVLPSGTVEVEFHDQMKALELLAKHHGIFKERIEIDHVNGSETSERLIAILGDLSKLPGAFGIGTLPCVPEPGALCDHRERGEMEAGPSLDVGQSVIEVGRPESD